MNTDRKKVAIIGAGCSGLAAIKCCLDEGFEPVCFEMDKDIGGLWNYNETPREGRGGVYKSCVMNTSKEMMAFSDFPPPENFPVFLPHRYVNKYFSLYADNFGLRNYIQFNTQVLKIKPAQSYDRTGRWDVTFCSCGQEKPDTQTFDAVAICTGHHTFPYIPHFEGVEEFKGTKKHSHSYRTASNLAGKNVLVVGIGNSGADIATDISHTAAQVYLSTRRGAWVINRKGFFGLPADAIANSRFMFMLPRNTLQYLVEKMSQLNFNHETYGLKPVHRALESHPTINDELPLKLLTSAIKIKPNVHRFSQDSVTFEDGSEENIDAVIFATGYNYRIPFVDDEIIQIKDNETNLFKLMFPPHLKHPTLAVIGMVQAVGALVPISEMQCRYFAQLIKGNCQLPPEAEMRSDIYSKRDGVAKGYYTTRRHTIQTYWIEYMDDIASKIGCKPDFWRMLSTDPFLAIRCIFGPCVPAQYRLEGPGKWNGAKSAIQNAMGRYNAALRTKVMPRNRQTVKTDIEDFKSRRAALTVVVKTKSMFIFFLFFMFLFCSCMCVCL